jgi:hypothetical protein
MWCSQVSFHTLSPKACSPFVLHSWIDLTTIDIQKRICSVFNYSISTETEDFGSEIDLEIDTSFENIGVFTPRDFFDTGALSPIRRSISSTERLRANSLERNRANSSTEDRPRLRSRANSIDGVSNELLTPLRRRVHAQLADMKLKRNIKLSTGSRPHSDSYEGF